MNTERDPRLGALLSSQTPPEHRPGFWEDLHDEIADGPPRPAPVVAIDALRRRAPMLLVAAAAIAVVALVGFGYLGGDDGDVDVATQPAPDATGDPETDVPVASGDLGAIVAAGDPVERGTGRVVGVSPDGRWLYVTDDAGDGGRGCEGAPRQALYVEAVDGGERRVAALPEQLDATTVWELEFDRNGRTAAVVQCEGFEASIVAADIAADGTLTNLEELTLPEPECHDGTVDGITDIAYSAPGRLVATTNSVGDGATTCQHLFSLPDTPSEPTLLGDAGALWVESTPDGRIVTADRDGRVAVDGDVIHRVGDGGVAGLSLSPSGTSVAVSGGTQGDDDVVISLDDGSIASFATEAYEIEMVDDVNGIMTADVGGERVVATFRAGEPTTATTLVTGNVATFVLTPTSDRVLVTVIDDTGESSRIIEVRLSR